MAVLGVAVLAGVNVNLSSRSSNVSRMALKNMEALTQENPGDWHSGECGTKATTSTYFTLYNGVLVPSRVEVRKECDFTANGSQCESGLVTTYFSYGYGLPPHSVGSYSIQHCQG